MASRVETCLLAYSAIILSRSSLTSASDLSMVWTTPTAANLRSTRARTLRPGRDGYPETYIRPGRCSVKLSTRRSGRSRRHTPGSRPFEQTPAIRGRAITRQPQRRLRAEQFSFTSLDILNRMAAPPTISQYLRHLARFFETLPKRFSFMYEFGDKRRVYTHCHFASQSR